MRYWDGQPVYFVCCERSTAGRTEDGRPLGRIFWCIAIEVLEGEAKEDDESENDDEESQESSSTNDDVD